MSERGDEKLLNEARERFEQASQAEAPLRAKALEALRFRAGEQWPEHIKTERERDKRPCLVLDRTGQFVRQVTNNLRQNEQVIEVDPVDNGADPETAEIIQGLIKHIEYRSVAKRAYDAVAEYTATMGFGHLRLRTKWVPRSFHQEILIEPISNQFSVYTDPFAVQPDRSDARYRFIVTRIPEEEFRRLYPQAEISGLADWSGLGASAPGWFGEDGAQVAEYFRIETEEVEIAELADGSTMELAAVPEGAAVLRTRVDQEPRVKWAKITGTEVLEEKDLPGTIIPIVTMVGEELDIDGERYLAGVVAAIAGAQQQYNFMATAETEAIALAPKAPWQATPKQIAGFEHLYRDANTRNIGVLYYNPDPQAGTAIPARAIAEPAIQAISLARMQAAEDMKAGSGIYDASLGARSNEISGRAINARQAQGDTANFHYADNRALMLATVGKILLEWIPVYYDGERVERIIGKEGDHKTVRLNGPTGELDAKTGLERVYDLTAGRYDVRIGSGPNQGTARQQAVESMMQIAQAYPQIMQVAGDLMVEHMDWPGARALATRLKKTLPAELREDEGGEAAVPPQVQARVTEMQRVIEQLTQALDKASEDRRTKRMELDSRERIAAIQAQVELAKTEAQLHSKENVELLYAQLEQIRAKLAAMAAPERPEDEEPPAALPVAA